MDSHCFGPKLVWWSLMIRKLKSWLIWPQFLVPLPNRRPLVIFSLGRHFFLMCWSDPWAFSEFQPCWITRQKVVLSGTPFFVRSSHLFCISVDVSIPSDRSIWWRTQFSHVVILPDKTNRRLFLMKIQSSGLLINLSTHKGDSLTSVTL